MRRIVTSGAPVLGALVFVVAILSASVRAEAHLTVCDQTNRDLAIAEAYTTPKGEWDVNSAVLVRKSTCRTLDDGAAASETVFYLRVLSLTPTGHGSFHPLQLTYAGATKSFCDALGGFSSRRPQYTLESADNQSTCTYYKTHIHDSGTTFDFVTFYKHVLPRPTTRLNLA